MSETVFYIFIGICGLGILGIIWGALAIIFDIGGLTQGRELIPLFCESVQRYNFMTKWKEKIREAYNSISMGMTFEEINQSFKRASISIETLPMITPSEIPPAIKSQYFPDGTGTVAIEIVSASTVGLTPRSDIKIQEYMTANEEQFKASFQQTAEEIKKETENIVSPVLLREEKLTSGVIRSVYRWDLPFDFITSQTHGQNISDSFGNGHISGGSFSDTYSGGSYSTSSTSFGGNISMHIVTTNNSHSATTEKAYIQITFEDGKMVKREQEGLFDI